MSEEGITTEEGSTETISEETSIPKSEETQDVIAQETSETSEVGSEQSTEGQAVPDDTYSMGREEYDNLKSEVENMRSMMGRQSNEVGTSRQKIRELEAQVAQYQRTPEQINDAFEINPHQALSEYSQLQQLERNLENERAYARELETKDTILRVDPNFESKVNDIGDLMLKDGVNPQDVQDFKSNPYWADSAFVINYSRRVESEGKLNEMQEKLNKLDPKYIGQKISEAANSSARITPATGGSNSGDVEVTSDMIEKGTSQQRKHFAETGEWINS